MLRNGSLALQANHAQQAKANSFMKTARQKYRAGKGFCFLNCLLDGMHTILLALRGHQLLLFYNSTLVSHKKDAISTIRIASFLSQHSPIDVHVPILTKTNDSEHIVLP